MELFIMFNMVIAVLSIQFDNGINLLSTIKSSLTINNLPSDSSIIIYQYWLWFMYAYIWTEIVDSPSLTTIWSFTAVNIALIHVQFMVHLSVLKCYLPWYHRHNDIYTQMDCRIWWIWIWLGIDNVPGTLNVNIDINLHSRYALV